jgi:hypothetical protein
VQIPDEMDGILYLADHIPPDAAARWEERGPEQIWPANGPMSEIDQSRVGERGQNAWFERVLMVTKDPTTPPHVRKKCVKWAHVGPMKTCIGWRIDYQWFYVRAVLRVGASEGTDVKDAVEECLKQGAIAALVAAILSGGTAAAGAAAEAVKICLVRKLGEKILSVSIDLEHYWGNWG